MLKTVFGKVITLVIFTLVLSFSGCGESSPREASTLGGRTLSFSGNLSFLSSPSDTIKTIDIAVASTPSERNLGLMDVRSLPSDAGMLFIFDEQDRLSFWMANTPLPLDLIFVNEDHQIVHIHHNAQPFSRQSIDSVYPAIYVVEVNAGFAVSHDLQPGQSIVYQRDISD